MAKEEIYTIPLNEAFDEDCECPMCHLYRVLESQTVDFVLGPSYMEVDVRGRTNELGFCMDHFQKLYAQNNRLGVALMLESHIKKMKADLENDRKKITPKSGGFSLKKTTTETLSAKIDQLQESCYICDRVNTTMDRYMDTFFYLYKKDSDFVKKVENSKGLCIAHYTKLLDMSYQKLNKSEGETFRNLLNKVFDHNLDRVIGDLEWFIKKNDYRFANEPWYNGRDSVIRSIEKIASFKVNG